MWTSTEVFENDDERRWYLVNHVAHDMIRRHGEHRFSKVFNRIRVDSESERKRLRMDGKLVENAYSKISVFRQKRLKTDTCGRSL